MEARCDQKVPPPFQHHFSVSGGALSCHGFFSLNDNLNLTCSEVHVLICAYVGMHPPQGASPLSIPRTFFDGGEHGIFGNCEIKISTILKCFFPLRCAGYDFWYCALRCEATVFTYGGTKSRRMFKVTLGSSGSLKSALATWRPVSKEPGLISKATLIAKVVFIDITTSCLHHKVTC